MMSINMENETKITPEELLDGQYFHGHKCPAMPQGLRAGHLAMDILGVQRARGGGELKAIVEIGDHHFSGCFADGVQFATGCTFGKGNIVKEPLGKFALTLIDTRTKRAVRVSSKYDRMKWIGYKIKHAAATTAYIVTVNRYTPRSYPQCTTSLLSQS